MAVGRSVQDRAAFKFLCNAGQVHALGNRNEHDILAAASKSDGLTTSRNMMQNSRQEKKRHRRSLKTWSISQKPMKGKYFWGLRHLWLTRLHAVMWEQLGGHCSELVAECHMRHCSLLSWWVPLASLHYLWEIAGNLEINKWEVLLLCLAGMGWGGVFQIRNYFTCTQGLVYGALYILLSQMAMPLGNIAIVLKPW